MLELASLGLPSLSISDFGYIVQVTIHRMHKQFKYVLIIYQLVKIHEVMQCIQGKLSDTRSSNRYHSSSGKVAKSQQGNSKHVSTMNQSRVK